MSQPPAPLAGSQASGASRSPQQGGGDARWEIELYGGASFGRTPTGGTKTLPNPGPPILTTNFNFPSRQIPSWFFGDGATLLNDANLDLDVSSRVVPLDAALASLPAGSGGAFGVRVRRPLTRRLSAEAAVDFMLGSASGEALSKAIAQTRDSFKAAFAGLLATGPFSNVVIDATSAARTGVERNLAVTGAVHYRLVPIGPFMAYAVGGVGILTGASQLPSGTIDGRYRFVILNEVPIDESDHVAIAYKRRATVVGVFGASLRRDLSGPWGLSVDARVLVGRNTLTVLVDANPSVAALTPAGFVESFTNPSVQFSNNPSTGRQSTLSGPSLKGFQVFSGAGLQTRVLLTVAVFRRF